MAVTIKYLTKEVDEVWDDLQELREERKKYDEFIDAISEIAMDYLEALKAASDKYGGDFENTVFAGISALAKTVSTFGAEETLCSLKSVLKTRKYKEDKVDN